MTARERSGATRLAKPIQRCEFIINSIKAALFLCLLIALSRATSLKQFLKSEPDSDLLYLVYIDTYNANRCSPSNLRTYETLTENGLPENMRAISFTDQES